MVGWLKKSANDVTTAFLKNQGIFNWKRSERPHKKGGVLRLKKLGIALGLRVAACRCRLSLLIKNN